MRIPVMIGASLSLALAAGLFADYRIVEHIDPVIHQAPEGGLDLAMARAREDLFKPGLSTEFARPLAKPGDLLLTRALGFPLLGYWSHDATLIRDETVVAHRRSPRPPAWVVGVGLACAPLLLSMMLAALLLVLRRPRRA